MINHIKITSVKFILITFSSPLFLWGVYNNLNLYLVKAATFITILCTVHIFLSLKRSISLFYLACILVYSSMVILLSTYIINPYEFISSFSFLLSWFFLLLFFAVVVVIPVVSKAIDGKD